MKDFKKENGYDNMETEKDMYDGVILKNCNEGYRYYSASSSTSSSGGSNGSSNGSGGSSGSSGSSNGSGTGSYDCSYCLDTGKTTNGYMCTHCTVCPESLLDVSWDTSAIAAIPGTTKAYVPISASADVSEPIYLRIVVENRVTGETSWDSEDFSTQSLTTSICTLENGEYNVYAVMKSLSTSYQKTSSKKYLNVTQANTYSCNYCYDTGLTDGKHTVCTHCDKGSTYIKPITFAYNYSKNTSGYEMDFAALCEDGWNMYLDLYSEDMSRKAHSKCVSALGVGNSYYPLAEGRYIIEAKASTSDGYSRTQQQIIEITEAGAVPVYEQGFSYTVNSYDEDTGLCNVTMVARYKDAPGTYLDIARKSASEDIVASSYKDGSLVILNADMPAGDYIAKTSINYVNYTYPKDEEPFKVSAEVYNADKILGNKRRILLLYVNSGDISTNNNYTDEYIQAILDSGATEFLITTADSCNLDVDNNPILTEIPFVPCSTNTSFATVYGSNEVCQNYFNLLGMEANHFTWNTLEDNATHVKNLYRHIWGWWDDNSSIAIDPKPYYEAENGTDNDNIYLANKDLKIFSDVNRGIVRSGNNSYLKYYNQVVSLATKLIAKKSNCKLWIGLPGIINGATFRAEEYNAAYTNLINKFKASGIWSSVVGIYYGTEDIPGGYSAFEDEPETIDFNNPVVKNMRSVKSVLGDKLFLWIPYYHTNVTTRVGNVVNKTNIFDIVILQTSYFFSANKETVDMDLVEDSVVFGKCLNSRVDIDTDCYKIGDEYFPNESFVVGGFTDSTGVRKNIGFEIEMDSYSSELDSNDTSGMLERHNTFVNKFGKYVVGTNVDVAFYAGTASDMMTSKLNIIGNIMSFFENGTATEAE